MKRLLAFKLYFFALFICLSSFFAGFFLTKVASRTVTKAVDSPKAVTFAAVKTDRPELKFFVMSFCPYGNQAESALRPVFDLLKNKADFTPHYIFNKITDLNSYCQNMADQATNCLNQKNYLKSGNGTFYTSLHGRQEASQSVRELCAWKQLDSDKTSWWNFVKEVNKNCTANNADTCWEQQGKVAGLDTDKITECFNKNAFDIIDSELTISDKFKVTVSPTLFINDILFPPSDVPSLKIGKNIITEDKYRTPDTLKEGICASMKKSDKACSTVLPEVDTTAVSTGGCGI